jgi:hypothetical protein
MYLVTIYIYKSETGWLDVFVCVLLGDGGLLLCSGGVFFLVSSKWYFLWGPFRGGIFFGVRSECIYFFACFLVPDPTSRQRGRPISTKQ